VKSLAAECFSRAAASTAFIWTPSEPRQCELVHTAYGRPKKHSVGEVTKEPCWWRLRLFASAAGVAGVGCYGNDMTPAKMIGRRFGRLIVTSETEPYVSPRGQIHRCFLVLCKCGTRAVVRGNCLRSGHSRSCGCLVSKTPHRTHGNSSPDSPEYGTWKEIMKRCHSPRDVRFQHYGGRGIKVCMRWRRSFAAFLVDMGRRPSPKHLIARIDDEGDYRPSNCRWATVKKQRANRRDRKRR
jgi:hypothetical protein